MNIFKSHAIYNFETRLRQDGTPENAGFTLDSGILFNEAKHIKQYFMRFENINIPLTYYNIDGFNNTFKVIETDGVTPHTLTIVLDQGNYTASELIGELEGLLDAASISIGDSNNYTLTYDIHRNKITFLYDGGTSTSVTIQTIATGSTLNDALGLGKPDTVHILTLDNTLVLADGVDSEAPFSVNVDLKNYIFIDTNISSKNHHRNGRKSSHGVKIDMNVERNENRIFENHQGAMVRMNDRSAITEVNVRLVDEFGNTINLNGSDYSFDLVVYELTKDEIN